MEFQYAYQTGTYKMNIHITNTKQVYSELLGLFVVVKCNNSAQFFKIMLSFIYYSPCELLPSDN